MRVLFLLLGLCLSANVLFSGCEPDTEFITSTDTVYIQHTDTLIITLTDTVELTAFISDTASTWILLRHAETAGSGSDPGLSSEGMQRAQELKRMLKNVALDAVFATQYIRTQQTVEATAADQGLTVQNYAATDYAALFGIVETSYQEGNILIAGHSNTIPAMLNWLTASNKYSNLPESQYDNLYVVQVFEAGRAKVTHLKYGKATP